MDSAAVIARWVEGESEPMSALLLEWRKDSPGYLAKNVSELMEAMLKLAGPDAVEGFGRSLLAASCLSARDWQICLTGLQGRNPAPTLALACLEAQIAPAEAWRLGASHFLARGLCDEAALLTASALAISGIEPSALKPVWSGLADDDPAYDALVAALLQFWPPNSPRNCWYLVTRLDELGASCAANTCLLRLLLEQYPNDPALFGFLMYREAFHLQPSVLKAALERLPALNATIALYFAQHLEKLGDYKEAIILLQAALAQHPNNDSLWFWLAYILSQEPGFSRLSDVQTIIKAYEQSLFFTEHPDDQQAINGNLARVYCYAGQKEASRAALHRLPADNIMFYWPRSSPWPAPQPDPFQGG